jgi:tetratricopeptide (TPR) repeat protein
MTRASPHAAAHVHIDADVALAEVLSVAAQAEPSLIRAVRLDLFPTMEPEGEAEFWFSPLVSRRGADGVAIDEARLAELRAGLLSRPWARKAFELIADHHAGAAKTVRLEESLTRTALLRDPNVGMQLKVQWHAILDAMSLSPSSAKNFARWVLRATRRLPPEALNGSEAKRVVELAGLAVGGQVLEFEDGPSVSDEISDLAWAVLGTVNIGVRIWATSVQFRLIPEAGDRLIPCPSASPIVLRVREQDEDSPRRLWLSSSSPTVTIPRAEGVPSRLLIENSVGDLYELATRRRRSTPSRPVTSDMALRRRRRGQRVLEVLDYEGPTRWRWRLKDSGGRFRADHVVELNPADWQYEAFVDLWTFLRWNTVPDHHLQQESELVAEIGSWIAAQAMGPVFAATLATDGQPVLLRLPPEASVLASLPWELARVDGKTLVAHRVRFVIDQQPQRPSRKTGVGRRLRMLAVFSLPEGAAALSLRKERFELARLVHEIAKVNNRSIELRVLQYGATRKQLQDALLERDGWDVVHLSGHGLPAGLVLEDDTGLRDLISRTELVELLDLAADRIKLVTLSAGESAAAAAAEYLRQLRLAPPARYGEDIGDSGPPYGFGTGSLPAVAAELVARLDCAVLAMRYPVVDDFTIALAGSFYDLVLGQGQLVAQALALTLPRVAPDPLTAGALALSIGAPALFGARANDLSLAPPAGGPVVPESERLKLAEFPPQPPRFVGRMGAMSRASAALAPRSGKVGVLLHGMAGGGKTACALELAYTHQQAFPLMAWHQAPAEGADITTALSDFAFALERQLPGLKLADMVNDTTTLRRALPGLTEALERNRVLIVLDTAESLLTADGAWRDERWGSLVGAMTTHRGLSRLVLTSRRRPTHLNPAMLVEAVHALSLRETVLLAREWPHLRTLIDGIKPPQGLTSEQARALAARTLAVVQGHPKLIELANGHAQSPAALSDRLDEADRTWLVHGTKLEPFLRGEEPAATDTDYLTVLQGWTRATTTALPSDSAILFQFLCCLDENDRVRPVLDGNWADLWHRLEHAGAPPDLDTALAPLVEQALVATETAPDTGLAGRMRIHPGVADTGRATTPPEFATAVATELGNYWLANLAHALDHEQDEQLGWLVLHAARCAAPYLLRQHRWTDLATAAEQVLHRDTSTATAAALLPMLAAAVHATPGGAEAELPIGRTHARTLAILHPEQAETQLSQQLDTAIAQGQYGTVTSLAGDLVTLYLDSGRLDQALALADVMADYTRRAGYGPWTQLGDQTMRLQILNRLGRSQQVLDTVEDLLARLVTFPDPPNPNDSAIIPWAVRETLLNAGVLAAHQLGHWQQTLDLNGEILASMSRRGATDAEQANAAFNDYWSLLRLGRLEEARDLLSRCRAVFETTNNIPMLGRTISALADVEETFGNLDQAIALETDALRLTYLAADPYIIGSSHHHLADCLDRCGEPQQALAHQLAAAIIAFQIGSGQLSSSLQALARLLTTRAVTAPKTFSEVCQFVDRIEGVRLADIITRLPQRARDGQAAMTEVLDLATQAGADRAEQLAAAWEPVLSALHASLHHPDPNTRVTAASALNQALVNWARHQYWRDLVSVLRRMYSGDYHINTDGLDPIDTAITQRAIDILDGTATTDPTAWRVLVDGTET